MSIVCTKASLRRNAMKIELKSREGSVYKKLCNSVSEANSDTELIVPDSLEDILRILSCRRQCRIREKNVGQDAVSVSGEIDVTDNIVRNAMITRYADFHTHFDVGQQLCTV